MIHIAVALHDPDGSYSRNLGACLCSLFANASSPMIVHLLHTRTLTPENKQKFSALGNKFGREINYIDVEDFLAQLRLEQHSSLSFFSPATISRLFLPQILPNVTKVIYLDADMIVDINIEELWSINLQGYPLGAVPDLGIHRARYVVPRDQECDGWANGAVAKWKELRLNLDTYFNAGTLLLDLDLIRQQRLFEQAISFLENNTNLPCPDQDALNATFHDNYLPLPFRFNVMISLYPTWSAGPCIWHFTGLKPWEQRFTPHKDRYDLYLQHTPWQNKPTEDVLEDINQYGETTASIPRRLSDCRFSGRWFRGKGVDIGCGVDGIVSYLEAFPLITEVRSWDMDDGDAQYMASVPDGTYDFVYSSHCLEHMVSPEEAMKNWMRILKPGGHLIVAVPDEDLYEQGHFPSRFNPYHKWTFTMFKPRSWSEKSINVFALLANLGPEADPRKVEVADHLYRYRLPQGDQTHHPTIEVSIEMVIRKRPQIEIQRGGRLPSEFKRPQKGSIVLRENGKTVVLRDIHNANL